MELRFGYGNGEVGVNVPDRNLAGILTANPVKHPRRGEAAVRYALAHPIGAPALAEAVSSGETVAIVTSDISRPMPTAKVLPSVLAELEKAGIRREDITVVFALGSHRGHTEEERKKLLGPAYGSVRAEDSGSRGFVHLGTTGRGTPVDIDRTVAEADRRICLGNIEFHYFAGYSGGAKALMPGVSTRAAIQNNHSMMLLPQAKAGSLQYNPLRRDIEEAGRIVGIDYIVNVVLDEHKEIVYAAAGDPVKAHRAGCRILDRMYRVAIPQKADIVIVSQGGAPKDANLYQVQKALENAGHAVKDGGQILLAGACSEGFGNPVFEAWLREASSPEEVTARIRREFVLGGHKAAAVASLLSRASVALLSEMPDETVRSALLTPVHDLQAAFDEALRKAGPDATVLAMPFGGSTLPVVREKS